MGTLPPPHVKLNEFVTLRCALGIRFRDTATKQIVRSGLRVKAKPMNAPLNTRAVIAQANPSGVWLFYGLSDLRTFELGTEDLPESGSPPGPKSFTIEVEDEEGRFLPCTFAASASEKGPMEFAPQFSSPPEGTDVPLFSAPSRPVPPGCAVIRTRLLGPSHSRGDTPARWALLEATTDVRGTHVTAAGLADAKGDMALMFSWPELVGFTVSLSPPGGLRSQASEWRFVFSAWHGSDFGDENLADLDAILKSRTGAACGIVTQLSPPIPFTHATLRYGRELLLPEDPFSPPTVVEHNLIITPAA